MSACVWFNLTSSCHYGKKRVGIIRSEVELAASLYARHDDVVRFCFWNGERFIDLTPKVRGYFENKNGEDWLNNFLDDFYLENHPLEQVRAPQRSNSYCLPLLSRREALKSVAQGILSLSPNIMRGVLNRLLIWGRDSVYQKYVTLRRRKSHAPVKNENQATRESSVQDIFHNGDIFFSLGLDWDYGFTETYHELRKQGVKIVTFCHDLVPILFPQYVLSYVAKKFPSYWMKCAEFSNLILCNSLSTEKSLLSFLDESGANVPKIQTIQLGDWDSLDNTSSVSQKIIDLLTSRYVLYVSTIERRKNHDLLYKVWHNLLTQHNEDTVPYLVFVGKKGWGIEGTLCDISKDPRVSSKVIILTGVNDAELMRLYRGCLFTVYPSVFEGWGMPVRESLAQGKFVLSSSGGALPEANAGFGDVLEPWDVVGWTERVWFYVNHPEVLKEKEKYIRSEFKLKKWEDTASDVFNKLMEIEK